MRDRRRCNRWHSGGALLVDQALLRSPRQETFVATRALRHGHHQVLSRPGKGVAKGVAPLTSGRLTYSRVRELTRVATPADESVWLEAARDLSMRALERRVSLASGRSPSRRGEPAPQHPEPMRIRDNAGGVSLSLPADVWALVEQAVRVVRAASGQNLTDAEALAAVARSALAHHNASVLGRPAPLGVQVTDQTRPPADPPRDSQTMRRDTTPHGGTEEGGPAGAGQETAEQVSPDEQRLLEVLASGRSLTLGTLCDTSRLSPSRAACALYELLHAGRVTRDSMGLCNVFRLRKVGAEFSRAD